MTQPVQILGSFWTLAVGADPLGDHRCHHDFRLRVETAAKAGFTAMSGSRRQHEPQPAHPERSDAVNDRHTVRKNLLKSFWLDPPKCKAQSLRSPT